MNYLQAFKEYLLSLKPQPSKITVKNYSIDVKHFILWAEEKFQRSFDPKEITAQDIVAFRQDKMQQLSARSLDRHVSSLRKFFQALKLQGIITQSPFDEEKKVQPVTDPFHLKEFKDFLYVYNASNLTIKNYIIDVKQFLNWAQQIAACNGTQAEDILAFLTDKHVSDYRDQLLSEHVFSASSINRKLSSLRKYLSWAASQNLTENKETLQNNLNAIQNVVSAPKSELLKSEKTEANLPIVEPVKENVHAYSPFPPFRLVQKLARFGLIIFDTVVTSPLAHMTDVAQKTLWSLQGKPLFKKQDHGSMLRPAVRVKNITKAVYAPQSVSINGLPWYEKIIFHARYTRPEWYKRYHSYALAHYFNWAILMIFMTVIGFGFYNSFVTKPQNGKPLLAATAPPRILSFQGRLTDSANNAITTATNLRFGIYTDATSTGSALLWQEVDNVQPDANGVFSVILGKNSGIQQSLFANNQNLYLGITVGTTSELTPRQQLATVAYATNAETLQGLPPITQSGAGTNNVVLALDSSGNLTIGAASTFQTVGGTFTISGNSVLLTSNAGTNGNVALKPDGTGFIDLQKPLVNTTLNNNISSAQGAVEVDDNFAVLATTSGIPAVTIDQNGSGAIFTASSSGTERFTINNSGTLKATNYTTQGGILYTDSTGLFLQTGTSTNAQCLIGGTTPSWVSCASIAGQSYWTLNNGALYPVNATLDMFVGGTSTAAAKFAVLNVNPGAGLTTVASISAQNAGGQAIAIDSAGTLQTVNNAGLTIGGNTTGNITLSPLNGNGTVTVNGTGLQTTSSTFNAFTNTATTLGLGTVGGTTTVNSALTITGNITPNGQFAASLIPTTTSINLGSSTNNFGTLYATNVILPSSGGVGGYWQLNSGAVAPTNITNDVLAGGTSTASAKFAILNMTGSGTPTASVSSGLSGNATFITADGTLQTARFQGLTVGGATTGNITLDPRNGSGTVTFTGYATGIIHSTSGLLSSSAINLAGGATEIINNLPLSNGGTNANLTADSGGIVYSGASSLAILAHSSSVGQCLVSGGTGAPSWSSCASAASNWWNMNAGALYPINQTFDLTLGSSDGTGSSASAKFAVLNMSGSGTPTASVSSGLNGTGMYFTAAGNLQTANDMGLTVGGTTTGNITLSPQNGNGTVTVNGTGLQTNAATFNLLTTTATTVNFAQAANNLNVGNTGGTTTFASATINDNQSTVALLSSPTTVNFAAGATTALNIGGSTSPTNLNGNVVIGTSNTNTFTPNALMNADLIPTGNGVINLGSSGHYYNTVYANNFVAPVSGGTSGFWSLANDVIYPVNTYFDLAIGGTATSSADWQVYSENVGSIIGGTATSSGMLSFRNTATKINLLNGATLDIQTSVGGDTGLASVLHIANNGDMTATGNLALNGGSLTTTAVTAGLFNTTATTVNIAGGASTATNIGHASGLTTLRGNLALGTNNTNTITVNGEFASSLIPTTTNTYDLGTSTLAWRNLYISGNYGGFWQRFSGVVSPYNITDDLAIGGTSTSAAKFQVFANTINGEPAGTATTSGQLTFSTSSQINLLNNANLGFYNSVGGDSGITSSTPALYIANSGHVGIGNNSPANFALQVTGNVGPNATNTYDLGTNTIAWRNLYLSGNYGGFWQRFNGAVAPYNITDDILAGSTATTSAKFAVLNMTGSGTPVASVSSGLSGTAMNFDANGNIQTLNDMGLTLGGTTTGNIALKPLNGIAGAFTTSYGSIIPDAADTRNLGSVSKEWDTLYVRQIVVPSTGGIGGFWQLSNAGVLAPANLTNDLAIGGIATGSATPFQIFSQAYTNDLGTVPAGTATTSGNLTFRGTAGSQTAFQTNILNGASLGFYNSVGGDKGITTSTPTLFLANSNKVGIGTNNPLGILDVASQGPLFPSDLTLGQTTATNWVANPSFEGASPLNTWTFNRTPEFAASNTATESALFGARALKMDSSQDVGSTFTATSQCIPVLPSNTYTASGYLYVKSGFTGNIGINLQTFTTRDCTGSASTVGRTNTTTTNQWTRVSSTTTLASSVNSVEVQWIADNSSTGIAYLDGVQLEKNASATSYLDGSLGPGYTWDPTGTPNATDSSRLNGSTFAYQTLNSAAGIGAASRGINPTLQLDQNGSGDIMTASASGTTEFKLTTTGILQARQFTDLDNSAYFLDPAASGTAASLSGSLTFAPGNGSTDNINFLNDSNLNIQHSVGGDTGLATSLYIQGGTGNVGIGTTSPTALLTVNGTASISGILTLGNGTTNQIQSAFGPLQLNYKSGPNTWGQALTVQDTTGNVGIGLTNPAYALDVVGAIQSVSGSTIQSNVTSGELYISAPSGTQASYRLYNGGGVAEWAMREQSHATNDNLTFSKLVSGTYSDYMTIEHNNGHVAIDGAPVTSGATEDQALQVNGNIYIRNSVPEIRMWNGSGTETTIKEDATNGKLLMANISTGTNYFSFNVKNGTAIARTGGVWTTGTPDIAENLHNFDGANAGDILVSDPTASESGKKTTIPYDPTLIGAVSTHPGFFMTGDIGVDDITTASNLAPQGFVPLVLAGRVPTKVSTKNGVIKIGDKVTSSTLPGVGMKATQPGAVAGEALDNFDPSKMTCTQVTSLDSIVWPADQYGFNKTPTCYQLPDGTYVGKIMVLIKAGWNDPTTELASIQGVGIYLQNGVARVTDAAGQAVSRMGIFLSLAVGNLQAGIVNAQQIATNSLAIATNNVSIAGVSLENYIVGVVQNALNNGVLQINSSITSPIASIDELHTNLISPLASNSAVAIDLTGSKFTIRNNASGSAVATIDNTGNATFSGTLNSQNLAVNSDATISGTLHAGKIVADDIEGLSAVVGTLSAQNITNVTNIYFATPSGTPTGGNYAMGQNNLSSSSSGMLTPYLGYTNIASYSGFLAYVPNLSASTALFDQGLTSLGPTALSDTTITGQLSIGTSLILANNSVNVLGSSFEIQPLRQGGVNFEGGLLAIDTDGNLTVNGNAVFAKTLAAHIISPLSNNDDLTFKLGQNPTATGAALATSNLSVQNASGSGIFTVDQLGNLMASGAANIAKLNFNLVAPAMAVSDTEVVATGSAGTAVVKAHQTEVTIDNPLVTDKSLIYITPVGQSGVTPYLIRQVKGTSFTVGISLPQYADTTFNWLIVN